MKKKAYSASDVNEINLSKVLEGRDGQSLVVGQDVGKESILAVLRWSSGDVCRPWKIRNPSDLKVYVELLKKLGEGRTMRLGLEPTGTYGDPLRQALADASLAVHRVSSKATHDYAEIYDGVPSQHDGKDAAVVAELVALGKCREWPWRENDAQLSEMRYWVRQLQLALRQQQMWTSQLEGQIMRHWPELSRELKLTSRTLLRIVAEFGDPFRFASSEQAAELLRRWSFGTLKAERIASMIESAKSSAGVRTDRWSRRQLKSDAKRALRAKRMLDRIRKRLEGLASQHEVLRAQSAAVGGATACVLWVHLGDPREYSHAGMYRKAMGLNLRERSSGKCQGELKITKRGHPAVRRWLYFSALRWIKSEPVKSWFASKKADDVRGSGKMAVVSVMRKLALGLHRIGTTGGRFEAAELFSEEPARQAKKRRRRKRGRGRAPRVPESKGGL